MRPAAFGIGAGLILTALGWGLSDWQFWVGLAGAAFLFVAIDR